MPLRRALVSVSDKTGLADFAKALHARGVEFISTGGTAKALGAAGVPVTPIERVTGVPEMMGGRVKTLHPVISAGILARREDPEHVEALAKLGAEPIDLVVVNLYPFEATVRGGAPVSEAIEQIDIGGPTLVRSAAKNHEHVTVVVEPARYGEVLAEVRAHGDVTPDTRRRLAVEAFEHTARYDAYIAAWLRQNLTGEKWPAHFALILDKIQDLRYGENAHQSAAFYRKPFGPSEASVINARQLHGKELSYNNIIDVDAAIESVKEFERPSVCIVKHATPCGIASAELAHEAWTKAFATDTYSPFGGIVAANRPLGLPTAQALGELFLEVVAAPGYGPEALAHLKSKKNLRILEVPWEVAKRGGIEVRSVTGGFVVQDRDVLAFDPARWKVVTTRRPSEAALRDMLFACRAVRHVRSNSVVFVKDEATVGIGGGQTSRVDATSIATTKGGDRIRGSVMASDAFFPFRDAVDVAAKHGVAAIVHPGGSIRDAEVIAAAEEHGIPMVFTGQRAFRH